MTEETNVENEDNALDTAVESEGTDSKPESLEDYKKAYEDQLAKNEKLDGINREVIDSRNKEKKKNRKFEKAIEEKASADLAEQGKYKELYETEMVAKEALQSKIRTNSLDEALSSALSEAEAISVNTVMKLVDKDSIEFDDDGSVNAPSLEAAINSIKESDPVLFGSQQTETNNVPPVKRATEGENLGGYSQEISACKTDADIDRVMRKYDKVG